MMVLRLLILLGVFQTIIVSSSISHVSRLTLLKNKGFEPHVIYDIGAYRGSWTYQVRSIFNNAQFFMFEANDYYTPDLKRVGVPYFLVLLGDREALVPFYVINNTGDSIFKEQTMHYNDGKYVEMLMPMTTLTKVVHDNNIPLPDLIKMDVQGAERLIIQGAVSIVCNAEVVILEVNILEYNHNAPLLYEVVGYLDSLGYCVVDILELHYLPSQELMQVDLLFAKKNSLLIKKGILQE